MQETLRFRLIPKSSKLIFANFLGSMTDGYGQSTIAPSVKLFFVMSVVKSSRNSASDIALLFRTAILESKSC